MKILIFGGIASGKTTIVNEICIRHTDFEIVSVDKVRQELGNHTLQREEIVQIEFENQIKQHVNQIIEATGFSIEGNNVFNKLKYSNEPILLIILRISLEETMQRIRKRQTTVIYPEYEKELEKMIMSVIFKLEAGKLPLIWSEIAHATIFQTENNNLQHKEFITTLISNYIKTNGTAN